MESVTIGDWSLTICTGDLPTIYGSYCKHAQVVDEIDLNNAAGSFSFLGVANTSLGPSWPELVIAQRYENSATFRPGFLVRPDTKRLFVGAGERLLCYDLDRLKRLWESETMYGFWGWANAGPYVLMSAEIEFAVYTTAGDFLWSTFVEPPWNFEISGDKVILDVMGKIETWNLRDGSHVY